MMTFDEQPVAYGPGYPEPPRYAPPAARRTNGAAVASLVLGLFGCIPFVPSVLAVVLGIVGFRAARREGIGGRRLAIAGIVLGLAGCVTWSFSIQTAMVLVREYGPAKDQANAFLREMGAGDIDAAMKRCVAAMDRKKLEGLVPTMEPWGEFVDASFPGIRWRIEGSNAVWHFEGTARFKSASKSVRVSVIYQDGAPRILGFAWSL